VNWPAPATLLRHVPPAVLVDAIVARDDTTLRCRADARPWTWPLLLEACAQTAGLLAGMRADGPDERAVIAEYRDVTLASLPGTGPVHLDARFDRRMLGFFRYAISAHTIDDRLLLRGLVTLAPVPA
jgi:hypothetical protein